MTAAVKRSALHKRFEYEQRHILPDAPFTLLRLDGKSFSTYTRDLDKPFDMGFVMAMNAATLALVEQLQGCQLAYVTSDEISLVLTPGSDGSAPWLGGNVAKMCSVSAAIATVAFNDILRTTCRVPAYFDARAWTLPDQDTVDDYLAWRQADGRRNAVSMAASTVFSHKQLLGVPTRERVAMLARAGIVMDDYPASVRLGRIARRHAEERTITYTDKRTGLENTVEAVRNVWRVEDAPLFPLSPGGSS